MARGDSGMIGGVLTYTWPSLSTLVAVPSAKTDRLDGPGPPSEPEVGYLRASDYPDRLEKRGRVSCERSGCF